MDIAVERTRSQWFAQVSSLFRGVLLDEVLWNQLEELLIAADVGVGPTINLLDRLKIRVRQQGIRSSEEVLDLLKQEMVAILTFDGQGQGFDVEQSPLVLLVAGVNGVGKTTSIAKLAQCYQDEGKEVLFGAADTFRAGAIDQLEVWGGRLGIDVIAHQEGADPGAVAFDALKAARARDVDVVMIDTAGRLHTKANLMEELKKIQRVLSRQDCSDTQRVLLVVDATTGQNGLVQAKAFTESIRCDGVFLAKLDGTAKGGVVVSIADELKLPILFVGTGEQLEDIATFDPRHFIDALFDVKVDE